jgi:hypothetical protein
MAEAHEFGVEATAKGDFAGWGKEYVPKGIYKWSIYYLNQAHTRILSHLLGYKLE